MKYNLHELALQYATEPDVNIRVCAELLLDEVRNVICDGMDCLAHQVDVRLFGSIACNTHGPGSDADIAVIPVACLENVRKDGSDVVCDVLKFRNLLFTHLQRKFGERFVCRQRKAILLCGTPQRMQADVVALIPRVWCNYCPDCGRARCNHGYEIRSYCEPEREMSTWPEQHHAKAAEFDTRTERRFTQSMRVLKGLLKSGVAGFSDVAAYMPPVLFENLLAHVHVDCYFCGGMCPLQVLRNVLRKVQQGLRGGSYYQHDELSGMRRLFDASQTWNLNQVQRGVDRLCALLG